MSWCLISPPADNEWTGGHLYNRQVMSAAPYRTTGYPLRLRPEALRAPIDLSKATAVVLDSLYLTEVEPQDVQRLRQDRRLLWLIHFLADEAPEPLSAESRERLRTNLMQADGWVVTSHFTAERLRARGCPSRRIRVVVPGLDLRSLGHAQTRRRSPEGAPLTLLTVAHAERRKGLEEVLLMLRALPSDVPDWQWEWIGATPPGAEDRIVALRLQAEEWGLSRRLRWRGALSPSEVLEAYARADIFVLLTQYETYGMVFSEALASGLPVIAPRLGEIARIVEEGRTGFVIPPGDLPEATRVLALLLKDAPLRSRMSAAAREQGRRFDDWAQTAERFEDALIQLGAP